MDGAESTAPSPPLDVDLNQLLQVIHAQVRASAQRDEQLKALLETFSSGQPPVPVVSPAPTPHIPAAAKPIAVDRPTLLSSATLADFTAWSEAWDDYARCQILATQPLLTRMSAFRQTLDEDLRRFIREGIISIPDTSDVEEAKDELRKFIRRQRNPLLDRIAGQALNGSSVNAVKSTYQKRKQAGGRSTPASAKGSSGPSRKSTSPGASTKKCPNCGHSAHTKNPCPAADRKCSACHRTGHFLSMCPSSGKKTVGVLKLQRTTSSRDSHTVTLDTQLVSAFQPTSMQWLPDTGSDIDAIGLNQLSFLGDFPENLKADTDIIHAANGTALHSLGRIEATLTLGSVSHTTTIHVYRDLDEALLSRSSLCALNLLPASWPSASVRSLSMDSATPQQLQQQLLEEFADVFDNSQLHPMDGPPVDIQLQPGAEPSCVRNARTIPFAYRDQVKSQLDGMLDDGIIEPVTEPSEWCHPIVLVPKKGSSEMRLTVDLRRLNDQVRRPTHPARTPHDAVAAIGKATYFTTLDARHEYWQVPLSDSAKPLTTFITPWGRFRFCRNPQGLISAGDVFNSRTDTAFDRLTNFVKVVDVGLVHDTDLSAHYTHVRDALLRAREHGITFSAKKFQFGAPDVLYCGYRINADGYTVDKDKIAAISDFPVPVNRTDVRSFFGLVNQCSDFSPRIAELSDPPTTAVEVEQRVYVGLGTRRCLPRSQGSPCISTRPLLLSAWPTTSSRD